MSQELQISPELKKFYSDWAKKIEMLIQGQTPVGDQGILQNSIKVKFVFNPNELGGKFVISSDATNEGFPYWKSLYYGSLDYNVKSGKGKEPVDFPKNKKEKKKGGGFKQGIRPTFFMNLKEVDLEMFRDEITVELKKFGVELVREQIKEDLKKIPKNI